MSETLDFNVNLMAVEQSKLPLVPALRELTFFAGDLDNEPVLVAVWAVMGEDGTYRHDVEPVTVRVEGEPAAEMQHYMMAAQIESGQRIRDELLAKAKEVLS